MSIGMFLPKLEQSRKELLDLSGRNRLTNFQRPTAKRGGIGIIDELPKQVFQILVEDGKPMTFLATTENTTGRPTLLLPLLDNPAFSIITVEDVPNRHIDTKLQTSLILEDLDRRLRRMFTTARTFVDEQGINPLYLAIGMLQWYESDTSQEQREAPLILIPVEIYRDNVRTGYKLRYTGDEIGNNISLQERLLREFSIQLPAIPEADSFDILAYFDAVAQVISTRPRWSVDRLALVLDFFNFNKLQMYKDLDMGSWSEVAGSAEHPVLSKLIGAFTFLSETMGYTDSESTSTSQSIDEIPIKNLVVDADSSQLRAIQYAMSGKNLVIQGPPGTGKSQTITNIIAEAIVHGKTVLFVAEKMAALEVVKRRLDKLGLGDACLELHSHKSNKKNFLSEIERTLYLAEPKIPNQEHNLRTLQEELTYLDSYCNAVNSEVGQTGVTPYRAYGLYLQADKRLKDTLHSPLQLPEIEIWKEDDFQYRLETVDRFQALLRQIGQPNQHPFWGSQLRVFLPTDQQTLRDAAIKAERAVGQLRLDADRIAELIGATPVERRSDADGLLALLDLVITAPRLSGITLTAPEWRGQPDTILKILEQAEQYDKYQKLFQEYLIPEAYKESFATARKSLAMHGGKFSRFWSSDYRQAQKVLKSFSRRDLPTAVTDQIKLVDAVLEVQRLYPSFEENRPLMQGVFGQNWRGTESHWAELREITFWMKKVYTSELDEKAVGLLLNYAYNNPTKDKIRELEFNLRRSLLEHRNAIDATIEKAKLDEQIRFGDNQRMLNIAFFEQTKLLHEWAMRTDQLQEIVSFNALAETLRSQQLSAIIDNSAEWEYASSRLVDLVKRTRYEKLIERAMREQPILASFNGATHQHRINRFRELDNYLLRYNRIAVLHQHWRNLPKYYAGAVGILREQFDRRRGHKSIRSLMNEAGGAIQSIKPVFMMSPFSIATFLPPGSVKFDLVVFDEASQVKPVDAFGAILRGKQTIVVGDDKQLPPTNFFDTTINSENEDDNIVADTESILGLFRAKAAHQEMLLWHYRSRHESLIAVSNYEFYGNKLIIFPSPDKERRHLGLVYHHLPQTVYVPRGDGVSGGHNDGEAQKVAQSVMLHARNHPKQTLLVATFNQQQRELIEDHLERLRKADNSCEHFFHGQSEEPFVIKNLENVQGDERDVVFISVGFGRDKDNKISMNFGPLNKDGGERRLNVLITRARDRCEVFTNLTTDDIDLSRTQSKGVRAFKRFLKYAQTGILDIPEATGGGTESPFEQSVVEALIDAGYQVATQIGTGGYRIDIAIIDNDQPGHYLLGVECDGATYHRARAARDRDRLRQEILEAMGWQIHRIWSTDWFRNPQREMQRVKESIEAAKAKQSVQATSDLSSEQDQNLEQQSITVRQTATQPSAPPILVKYEMAQPKFQIGSDNLHQMTVDKLSTELVRIISIETPVHVEEILQRISSRITKGVRERVELALSDAVTKGKVERKGDFFLLPHVPITIRDRSSLASISRKIDLIYPKELALAVGTLVKCTYGISRSQIAKETLRFLCYSRITDDMAEKIETVIDMMLKQGYLELRGNNIQVVDVMRLSEM